LRAKDFSCSLGHKYIAILDQKKLTKNFQLYFFSSVFGHQTPRSGLDLDPELDSLKMLDPNPYKDPDSMNPDPQLCLEANKFSCFRNKLKIHCKLDWHTSI
jgi:hypothetical protein